MKFSSTVIRFVCLSFCLALSGCQSGVAAKKTGDLDVVGSAVAVDFAQDGRLWRLMPGRDAVYVDYSTDYGQSYSRPVRVNPQAQAINAWPENPPAIKISASGRIHVLYYADEDQKATTYYSYSDDQGQSFSEPKTISDQAQTAMHYMDQMLVDEREQVYLFWHDARHSQHDRELGSGVLSLYYSVAGPADQTFVNRKITGAVCSCCRTAIALAPDGLPVVLARMVFNGGVRDHALIKLNSDGRWSEVKPVLRDQWQIEACPEHGPALSIADEGRVHMAWFTLGSMRKGIYYAHTDDYGNTVSTPLALGNKTRLPSHPDVLVNDRRVLLAWLEFDGYQTSVVVKLSNDRGRTWSEDKTLLATDGETSHPELIEFDGRFFLSWFSSNEGHQLVEVE